jgi:FkbM family methyltransferase
MTQPRAVTSNLIFDIGLHKGLDAQFYLEKGFSVVGLEASPDLCAMVRHRLAEQIRSGRLVVIEKALFDSDNETVEFYINPDKDDWGSLTRGNAEKGVGKAVRIAVQTVTLETIIKTHGVPHYIKCDIEGGDALLAKQLLELKVQPTFVSIEATRADDIARLLACGYDRFQLVNQYMHPQVRCPVPAREGVYVDARFSHETSGLFGRELPLEKWTDFAAAVMMFQDWYALRNRDVDLAIGWLDVHACKAAALA